jgi:hypothetical protein
MPPRRPRAAPLFFDRVVQVCFLVQFLLFISDFSDDSVETRLLKSSVPGNQTTKIFAAFLTDQNSSRVPDLRSYLATSTVPSDISFDAWFVNFTSYNDTIRHFLYPPDEFREVMLLNRKIRRFRRDLDLGSKFFFALLFFLQNTSAHWVYRATDDTIVNFANLGPFMRWLGRRTDPLRNTAVVGHCIDVKRFSYLQGGSGILLSRAAARRLVWHREWFMATLAQPEDVYFAKLLARTGISLANTTCPYFIGHDIYVHHRNMFWNRTLHLLPRCPDRKSIWVRRCRSFVAPLADLVFWHQEGRNRTLGQTIMFAKWVMAQPRNIQWWMNWGRPHLCFERNVSDREY